MASLHYLITGASRGIGLELAHQASEAGHRVSVIARRPEASAGLKELAKRHPGNFSVFAADVGSETSLKAVAHAISESPRPALDVIINNAGVYLDDGASFESLELRKVAENIETNAIAPMRVAQIFLPLLMKSAYPKLANISSLMGSIADNSGGGSYAYRMSKAALNCFTRCFAVDHPKIIALALHPGWVKTDMGGSGAQVEIPDSARGLLAQIARADAGDSGKFFDFEGEELPW